jgi:AcrR family transcriptional regulator
VSDETRTRILLAARSCFARYGYTKTTNKDVAALADITTGAIYHYFDSKQALFIAVAEAVSDEVFTEFEEAVAGEDHLLGQIVALLDAASRLHANDRTLAQFSAIVPVELQRHAELRDAIDPEAPARANRFYLQLAEQAAANGELPEGRSVGDLANLLVSITMGLATFGALMDDTAVHRGAVETLQDVLARGLPGGSPARRRRRAART